MSNRSALSTINNTHQSQSQVCSFCGQHFDADFPHECDADFGLPLASPYLEPDVQGGGVAYEADESLLLSGVEYELEKPKICGRSYAEFDSLTTFRKVFKSLDCNKWYCFTCGSKGGHIHRRRKMEVYEKLGIDPASEDFGFFLRQLIFTVPDVYRPQFASRTGLNQLIDAVHRIITKYFPAFNAIAYPHVFGDQSGGLYHPHINVHIQVPHNLGENWTISPEKLAKIRATWVKSLRGMGCVGIKVADIHYSFRTRPLHIMHAIKYMTRPMGIDDGYNRVKMLTDDMKDFLVVEMKGFRWIRYWGKYGRHNEEMEDKETMNSMEKRVGERLRFVGMVTESELVARFRMGELQDLGGGVFVEPMLDKREQKKRSKEAKRKGFLY